jgi:hypothetical protein
MSFDQYLQNRLKLAEASGKPDKIDARLVALHKVEQRDKTQQDEYDKLIKAAKARFKAGELERKAKASLDKRDEANRKADSHAKILIGVAAIELAKRHQPLQKLLVQMAGAMPSARKELINQLLGVVQDTPIEKALASEAPGPIGDSGSMPLCSEPTV